MAHLYADENYPYEIVAELRTRGHDVLTAYEAGKANQKIPDPEVLAYAITLGRAVLTRNRWDYIRLHRKVRPHAGIIICSEDDDHAAQAQVIHQALLNYPVLDNQLIRINKS